MSVTLTSRRIAAMPSVSSPVLLNTSIVDNGPVLLLMNADVVSKPALVESLLHEFSNVENHHHVVDRVFSGVVNLQPNTYKEIFIATSDSSSTKLRLGSKELDILHKALQPGGKISGSIDTSEPLDAVLAGFLESPDKLSFVKPHSSSHNEVMPLVSSIPLNRNKFRFNGEKSSNSVLPKFKKLDKRTRDKDPVVNIVKLSLSDDFDNDNSEDDDDLIDEDSLIDGSLSTPIVLPAKCDPGPGKKRRKACKDCTCGLKELELQEEEAQRQKQQGVLVTLSSDDITEIDFTVPGKSTGSCGSCALGDAFRCDGCPYLGLPPFKPGEIVSIAGLRSDDL